LVSLDSWALERRGGYQNRNQDSSGFASLASLLLPVFDKPAL